MSTEVAARLQGEEGQGGSRASASPASLLGLRRFMAWLAFVVAVSLLLCTSFFYFNGHKVDESEIVMNSVAIAAGNWSPQWSGYGHLAMYLPAMILAIVAGLMQLAGIATSYSDGIYLLFEHDAAYRITRLFYTVADVTTALLFARLISRMTGQRLVAWCCFAYFLLARDSWFYANYIRADVLVSLFTAIAAYVLAITRARMAPYLVGAALGAAIACKYSAIAYLPLVAVLLIDMPGKRRSWQQRIIETAIAGVVAIVAAFALQPRYNFLGIIHASSRHLSGAHFTQDSLPLGERLVRLWQLARDIEPHVGMFIATMWLAMIRFRQSAGLLCVVFMGIAPFAVSNYAREYWLIPFADAVRAAGWLGIACGIELTRSRLRGRSGKWLPVVVLAVTAVMLWRPVQGLRELREGDPSREPNRETARRWLYLHAANRVPLVYTNEKNYVLPRAYSFADYKSAARLSRVFIFRREKFDSLHTLFKRKLYSTEYADFSLNTDVPPLVLGVESITAERLGSNVRLCSAKHCYPARRTACGPRLKPAIDRCVAYIWTMDRDDLQSNLDSLVFRFSADISEFALCWYGCGNETPQPVRRKLARDVRLLELSTLLFAPQRIMGLDKIARPGAVSPGDLIVTSPTAYVPWLKKKGFSHTAPEGERALGRALNAKLVKTFNAGPGAVIQVYERRGKRSKAHIRREPPRIGRSAPEGQSPDGRGARAESMASRGTRLQERGLPVNLARSLHNE